MLLLVPPVPWSCNRWIGLNFAGLTSLGWSDEPDQVLLMRPYYPARCGGQVSLSWLCVNFKGQSTRSSTNEEQFGNSSDGVQCFLSWRKIGWRASGGSRQQQQQNARYLTATPPAADRLPPPLCSITSLLQELYHECVDNDGWARVLYDAHGGLEKLTLIHNIPPAPTVAAPPEQRKPGR